MLISFRTWRKKEEKQLSWKKIKMELKFYLFIYFFLFSHKKNKLLNWFSFLFLVDYCFYMVALYYQLVLCKNMYVRRIFHFLSIYIYYEMCKMHTYLSFSILSEYLQAISEWYILSLFRYNEVGSLGRYTSNTYTSKLAIKSKLFIGRFIDTIS